MRPACVLLAFLLFGTCSYALSLIPGAWCAAVHAQIVDDFSDGDFDSNPAWSGDVDAWAIEHIGGNAVLVSRGAAESDTISLTVPISMTFGRWTFNFSHRRVNLSTFNGARVFVCGATEIVDTQPQGYYLQFGTNNTDAVSLWHVDGDWATRRELGRSAEPLVGGDSSRLTIVVDRDPGNGWSVAVGGSPVLRADDGSAASCRFLALWVKHTGAGRGSFVFDAFAVEAAALSPPPPPARVPDPRDVVINEIQFDPPPFGSEFVELYNRSSHAYSLNTFSMRDAAAASVPLPRDGPELLPGAYAVIVQDAARFSDQFRTVAHVQAPKWPTLNNDGDHVIIEADGLVIDSVSYRSDDVLPDRSLERIDPDAPSDRYNFAPSEDAFGATPGTRNSRYERDTTGPRLLFVRQVDGGHLDLHFDEPIRADATPAAYVVANGIAAAAIVQPEPHLLRARFDAAPSGPDVRILEAVDLRGNRSSLLAAPISFRPMPSDIIINEILYEPRADDHDGFADQVEFVEIMNRSGRRLHVGGVFRTREPGEDGDADTVRVPADLTALEPDALLVLAADRFAAGSPVIALPPLTLLNGGDRIRLHNDRSHVLDDVAYLPSWHHPDLLERRGVSLERIDPDGSGADRFNWSSSVSPDGATPGRPNSVRIRGASRGSASALSIEPNPFSPDRDGIEDVVRITCSPSTALSRMRVRIFDLSGSMVRELVSSQITAGPTSFLWDGRDGSGRRLRTGVYIIVVEAFDARRAVAERFKRPVVLARRY
jgi:hypothetical protein